MTDELCYSWCMDAGVGVGGREGCVVSRTGSSILQGHLGIEGRFWKFLYCEVCRKMIWDLYNFESVTTPCLPQKMDSCFDIFTRIS